MASKIDRGKLYTLSDISDMLGYKASGRERVRYVIRSRSFKPAQRAGAAKLFDAETVGLIRDELLRIDAAKPATKGGAS